MNASAKAQAAAHSAATHNTDPGAVAHAATSPGSVSRLSLREKSMAAHPSSVGQKFQVLIATDTSLRTVRIIVHGRVTSVNLRGLDLVVRRAGTLAQGSTVIVDLSGAQAWESVRPDLSARAFTVRLATTMACPAPRNLQIVQPLYLEP